MFLVYSFGVEAEGGTEISIVNPLMVLSFKTFQNLLTGKMAINMSQPFKTLHNFLLLHYHTFQYPLKGFER